MKTPMYQHDCKKCLFHGTIDRRVDVYTCQETGGDEPTLILREGDEPAFSRALPLSVAVEIGRKEHGSDWAIASHMV